MNLKKTLLIAATLAACPLYAREKSDVVIMKNGDRITCEIKGLRSDTLFIKVDYILSTLSVNWKKVDHIESKQLFLVTARNGTVYTGIKYVCCTSIWFPGLQSLRALWKQ